MVPNIVFSLLVNHLSLISLHTLVHYTLHTIPYQPIWLRPYLQWFEQGVHSIIYIIPVRRNVFRPRLMRFLYAFCMAERFDHSNSSFGLTLRFPSLTLSPSFSFFFRFFENCILNTFSHPTKKPGRHNRKCQAIPYALCGWRMLMVIWTNVVQIKYIHYKEEEIGWKDRKGLRLPCFNGFENCEQKNFYIEEMVSWSWSHFTEFIIYIKLWLGALELTKNYEQAHI